MEFNYREVLKENLRERRYKNPAYSLRAYSRDLGVSSTALSDVLSGKRHLSKKNIEKVAEKLSFSPIQVKELLKQLNYKEETKEKESFLNVKEDEFQLISNWYYVAILTLCAQKNIENNPVAIGKRLGVNPHSVEVAIEVLKRLKLLNISGNKIKRTSAPLRITTDIPSYAIKNYHKENLRLVENSIDNVPLELREISSMTLNINPKKMKKAKKMIEDFKEKFTSEMEKTPGSEVYTLGMHFYPASLKEENE